MLTLRGWLSRVIAPVSLVILLDQGTKSLARGLNPGFEFGIATLRYTENYGMILGAMSGISSLQRMLIGVFGVFYLLLLAVLQYLIPIKSDRLRFGLSLFAGGALGNVVDRLMHGYVVDFMALRIGPVATGVFNAADAVQWLGVGLAFTAMMFDGQILWPPEDRRGRKWIHPWFQFRFIMSFAGAGLAFCLIAGVFFAAFLRQVQGDPAAVMPLFLRIYGALSGLFLLVITVTALHLSHRIVGPVFAFERFINDLMAGNRTRFSLRQGDEFQSYENLASRLQRFLVENAKVPLPPLTKGQLAPEWSAPLFKGGELDLKDFSGKKVWLCLYRYATCPLCVSHVAEIVDRFASLKAAGLHVIAVFESHADHFIKEETGATCLLLQQVPFPMVPDPRRIIYRHYRSQASLWALVHPMVLFRLIQAMAKGFRQRRLDGSWGRIPAHILINGDGRIWHAHYGRHAADHISWAKVDEFLGQA
jgi:signal peptidase II